MKITNARLKNLQHFLWIKRFFTLHYYSLLYYYLIVETRFSLYSRIQMFGKTEIHNFNVWKSQNTEFQSLEKPQLRIPMFGKATMLRIPMFRKAKTLNSNVWKSQNLKFQCLENQKNRIPIFGKAKIQSYSVWKSR